MSSGGSSIDYRVLPVIGRERIAADLSALGLGAGDTVLVHSAMSRIGNVRGGAGTVIQAFLDVLGASGTLAVPTFPFNGSMRAYLQSDPLYEVETTPSRVGAISETLRTWPGACRSLEPSHPLSALGPGADALLADHVHAEGGCDRHSPLYHLTLVNGWILLLGVGFANCTLLHLAEELARVPFIDFTTRYAVRCRFRGQDYTQRLYCHSTSLRPNFTAIEPLLAAEGRLVCGRVGQAECRLARAADILDCALAALRDNPYALRIPPG